MCLSKPAAENGSCRLWANLSSAMGASSHISQIAGPLAFSDAVGGCSLVNRNRWCVLAPGLSFTAAPLLVFALPCLRRFCHRGVGGFPCRAGGIPASFVFSVAGASCVDDLHGRMRVSRSERKDVGAIGWRKNLYSGVYTKEMPKLDVRRFWWQKSPHLRDKGPVTASGL